MGQVIHLDIPKHTFVPLLQDAVVVLFPTKRRPMSFAELQQWHRQFGKYVGVYESIFPTAPRIIPIGD